MLSWWWSMLTTGPSQPSRSEGEARQRAAVERVQRLALGRRAALDGARRQHEGPRSGSSSPAATQSVAVTPSCPNRSSMPAAAPTASRSGFSCTRQGDAPGAAHVPADGVEVGGARVHASSPPSSSSSAAASARRRARRFAVARAPRAARRRAPRPRGATASRCASPGRSSRRRRTRAAGCASGGGRR